MLTRKQHELLMFIDKHLRDTGFSPSFEEMKEALNLRSKSGIHRLITALEERGFLRRRAHRARALEVMRLPEATTPKTKEVAPKPEAPSFAPNVIRGNFANNLPASAARVAAEAAAVHLPLYGRIAAGLPIEALRDTVIIRRTDTADNGTIVVALVDENEVTLKRLRRRGNSIALEPANARHETRIFGPDRVRVQGKLVGLLRRY